MTTLNEMIEIIKAENPTIKIGNDQEGYTDLSVSEYEAQVADWAQGRLDKLAEIAANEIKEEAAKEAKQLAQAKLAALGLTTDDLKALGLGTN
jgi:lysophospholipase L1-like esterase